MGIAPVRSIARCALTILLALPCVASATSQDPFRWLRPVVSIDAEEQAQLDRREVVVRVLPAADGQLAVFAAAKLNAEAASLATWASAIAELKKGGFVRAVRRFSDPPVLEDVRDLTLEDGDLDDLRRCEPGDCAVKLTAAEIDSLRQATEQRGGVDWKTDMQQQVRDVVLHRLAAYQAGGFAAIPAYMDHRNAVAPQRLYETLTHESPYLQSRAFTDADVESFFYWSKEQYGAGKPVVSVTHVQIVRPRVEGPVRVAVIGREIFSTHYRNASLGITAVTEDAAGTRYLVYVNRSQLDIFGGMFGAWKRSIVEGRVMNETADVFREIRRRLESGPPPDSASAQGR
jgi:hypothetical protein